MSKPVVRIAIACCLAIFGIVAFAPGFTLTNQQQPASGITREAFQDDGIVCYHNAAGSLVCMYMAGSITLPAETPDPTSTTSTSTPTLPAPTSTPYPLNYQCMRVVDTERKTLLKFVESKNAAGRAVFLIWPPRKTHGPNNVAYRGYKIAGDHVLVILDGPILYGSLSGAWPGDGGKHHFKIVPGQKVRGSKTSIVPVTPQLFMLAEAMKKAPIDQCGDSIWP